MAPIQMSVVKTTTPQPCFDDRWFITCERIDRKMDDTVRNRISELFENLPTTTTYLQSSRIRHNNEKWSNFHCKVSEPDLERYEILSSVTVRFAAIVLRCSKRYAMADRRYSAALYRAPR